MNKTRRIQRHGGYSGERERERDRDKDREIEGRQKRKRQIEERIRQRVRERERREYEGEIKTRIDIERREKRGENDGVYLEIALGGEGLLADGASERFVARVSSHMDLERRR